jgi:hypothetical protein
MEGGGYSWIFGCQGFGEEEVKDEGIEFGDLAAFVWRFVGVVSPHFNDVLSGMELAEALETPSMWLMLILKGAWK